MITSFALLSVKSFANRIATIISIVVVLVLLGACSGKISSGGSASSSAGKTLRVMSYNIHHCNPPSKAEAGEIDLDAIVRVIQNEAPDLVALQEVDVRTTRANGVDQAAEIARKLNMHVFFGKAIDHQGGDYGVAILSKYPLSQTAVTKLPNEADPKSEPRILATGKLTLPGGKTIRFGSTHLDVRSAQNRDAQVKAITEVAAQENLPFILAGDFNATPTSTAIALIDKTFTRTCQTCEPTIPVDKPNRAIDFIYFSNGSPFKVLSHRVIPERYASDHLPIIAELGY